MIQRLYEGEEFNVVIRDDAVDSLPDWRNPEYTYICKELIKNADARKWFLGLYLKDNPPLLFSDPSKPFSDDLTFTESGFLMDRTVCIFREKDLTERKELITLISGLIKNGYLKEDKFSIINCRNCGMFSIGSGKRDKKRGFYCTTCGKPVFRGSLNKRIAKTYSLGPLLRDLLFKGRGRILEGIIYHQCLLSAEIREKFNIEAYARIQTEEENSKGQIEKRSKERDIILIDKSDKTFSPIIILAAISSSQQNEKRQVEECSNLGLPVIFVCARGVGEESTIYRKSTKIFSKVISDKNFPSSLAKYIIKNFI